MAYIFMDESWDLGFNFKKDKTSRYFMINFLFVENPRPIEKIVKNIFQSFHKKEIKKHNGSLHCFKEHPKTRLNLLRQLASKDISIMSIYIDKNRVYANLQNEKTVLYNYVTNILLDRVFTKKLIPSKDIQLIASQRETNKFLNLNFKKYLSKKMLATHNANIKIEIESHHKNKCLQVVDFISWSLFRKYEHHDESYYSMIKSKIIEERNLFG